MFVHVQVVPSESNEGFFIFLLYMYCFKIVRDKSCMILLFEQRESVWCLSWISLLKFSHVAQRFWLWLELMENLLWPLSLDRFLCAFVMLSSIFPKGISWWILRADWLYIEFWLLHNSFSDKKRFEHEIQMLSHLNIRTFIGGNLGIPLSEAAFECLSSPQKPYQARRNLADFSINYRKCCSCRGFTQHATISWISSLWSWILLKVGTFNIVLIYIFIGCCSGSKQLSARDSEQPLLPFGK